MIPPGITVLADGTVIGRRGHPLSVSPNKKGYLRLTIPYDGRMGHFTVHQLVCEAFHGVRPFPEAQVRHLDGNKLNNRADNLQWGTPEENWADRRLHGADNAGERGGRAKLTWPEVREIRRCYSAGEASREVLAQEYRIGLNTLSALLSGKTWIDPEYTPPSYSLGERHREAKLKAKQVREIRAKYAAGGVRHVDLATEYGVSKRVIGGIIRGEFRKNG
jgi:hypothetical protein